jgi:hypothetical protein
MIFTEHIKEIVDRYAPCSFLRSSIFNTLSSVLVHRYHDLDLNIHTEYIEGMSSQFIHYPTYFLDGSYLLYVGWVLSDSSTPVHLAVALMALIVVLLQDDEEMVVSVMTRGFVKGLPRLFIKYQRTTMEYPGCCSSHH